MASGSDILSAVNNTQTANISSYLSKLGIKESSNSSPDAARLFQGSDTVSFSDEARRLFADKSKNDVEVIQGLIDKGMDMLKGRYAPSNEIEKTYGLDALNSKVGESKPRLNDLMEKMRGALMDGDKSAVADAQKGIVQFFKELEPSKTS